MDILEYIFGILGYIFYMFIAFSLTNYIIRSLFFIKPMCNKYKIMASDLSNDISGRYPYIFISLLLIYFFGLFTYAINFYLFIIILIVYVYDVYFLINKYKKFNLLNYINEFSADLFDWEKIYCLNIDEDIKRKCFQIHFLNYDEFEEKYLEILKYKQTKIENKIKKN